jgi:hypothetical protein
MLLRYCLSGIEMVPVAPIITGIYIGIYYYYYYYYFTPFYESEIWNCSVKQDRGLWLL